MGDRVSMAGDNAGSLREAFNKTREEISKAAADQNVSLSISTIQRMEKNDKDTKFAMSQANFLAEFFQIPAGYLVDVQMTSTKKVISLKKMETGADLLKALDDSEGYSVNIVGEPRQKEIRDSILSFNRLIKTPIADNRKHTLNLYQGDEISKTKVEFEIRDYIDHLNTANYSIYANQYQRFEAYLSVDETGLTWMGPQQTRESLKDLADPEKRDPYDPSDYPDQYEGIAHRDMVQLTIKASTETILDWEVDTDPGKLMDGQINPCETLRNFFLTQDTSDMGENKLRDEIRKFQQQRIEAAMK